MKTRGVISATQINHDCNVLRRLRLRGQVKIPDGIICHLCTFLAVALNANFNQLTRVDIYPMGWALPVHVRHSGT
jgi:hypothetical protein